MDTRKKDMDCIRIICEDDKEWVQTIIKEYLKEKLSISVELDAYIDNRVRIYINLDDETIDYDFIDF